MNTCFRRQYLYQSLPSSSQFLGCSPKNQGVTVVGQTKHRWQGQKHTIVRLISQNSSKKTWCPRRSKHNHHLLYHLLYNTARFLIWCLTTAVLKDTPCITLNPARDETQSRPSIVQRCAEGAQIIERFVQEGVSLLAFCSQDWYFEQAKAITSRVHSDLSDVSDICWFAACLCGLG